MDSTPIPTTLTAANGSRPSPHPRGRRAIVIGGSMAGMTAARVLADRFDEVLVLERDPLPDTDEPRKGVPQGRQLHGLLKRGEELLDGLFPGVMAALVDRGAQRLDFSADIRWHHFGVEKLRFPSGIIATMASRPLIEQEVRRRLQQVPNVRILERRAVMGLHASEDRKRVTGVRLVCRDGEAGEEQLFGDLVVDACGRGSPTPRWLTELGYAKPEEESVRVDVCYATRIYRRPADTGLPYKALYVVGTPPHGKRLAMLAPIEGDRWIVVLAGLLGDHPPADEEGFLAFAKGLPIGEMHRVLSQAEPLGNPVLYKFPSHLRRHYERMASFPEGFVVLGDSHCSFNPIYGQGMTTATLGAIALGECVDEQRRRHGDSLDGLSRRFQARLAKQTDVPWSMSTGEDLRHPEVEGKRPFGFDLMAWYLGRVHRAVARDQVLAGHFLRAMHMIGSPTKLLEPAMAMRVLVGGIASRAATRTQPAAAATR